MIKIIQYRDKCIGCGICFELQPNHWRMSKKDGKAHLLHAESKKEIYHVSSRDPLSLTQFVAKSCPVNAIKVVT